jgi:hypothetical protein
MAEPPNFIVSASKKSQGNMVFVLRAWPLWKNPKMMRFGGRETNIVKEESASKRRHLQHEKGEKMVAKHKAACKLSAVSVPPDSVVTIWVDRQVVSHP